MQYECEEGGRNQPKTKKKEKHPSPEQRTELLRRDGHGTNQRQPNAGRIRQCGWADADDINYFNYSLKYIVKPFLFKSYRPSKGESMGRSENSGKITASKQHKG